MLHSIPLASAQLGNLERKYLLEAFDSGFISGAGPFVERFEHAFAKRIGTRFGVACSNGTASLHLALKALGVGPGAEVIVPDLTYVATANAVTYCGARPVFADVDPSTWCISLETVEPLVTRRTMGIIPVHLYGQPCDVEDLQGIADAHGLFILEDAAQAHGAHIYGKPVGSLGNASSFSFYGNKLVTTGEGGIICTDCEDLAASMRALRGHCMDPERRYWFTDVGYNYRMPNLCAAVGLAQVEGLDAVLAHRTAIDSWYREALAPLPVALPPSRDWADDVCWLFSAVLQEEDDRDAVIESLRQSGIDSRPFFASLSTLPFHVEMAKYYPVPEHSRRLARCGLNLPTGPHVSREVVERVAGALRAAL